MTPKEINLKLFSQAELRQLEIEQAGVDLCNFTIDLFGTFLLNAVQGDERKRAYGLYDSLLSASDNNQLRFVSALPRIQGDKDPIKVSMGEHGGVTVIIRNIETAETIYINAYGGMRKIATDDYSDQKYAHKKGHTADERTNEIASHPTYIGLHISGANGVKTDGMWATYVPYKHFRLDLLEVDNENIELNPFVLNKHKSFSALAKSLAESLKPLVKHIDSKA